MTAFGGFEPVFGKAQGRLESSPSHDLLPFLFYLRAKNSDHLLIHLTDFHANTWYSDMSTEYLEDMGQTEGRYWHWWVVGGFYHLCKGSIFIQQCDDSSQGIFKCDSQ